MTDAHCHIESPDADRCFVCEISPVEISGRSVPFYGCHPWWAEKCDIPALRERLLAEPFAGVGEIGLDRLKDRNISPVSRKVFEDQLALAAELGRPVVLHGAKCWGEVVKACKPYVGRIPAFLFHGFSRSAGLVPEIAAMNGFVSIGPAILNDHALNYRQMAAQLPEAILLAETDLTADTPLAERPKLTEIVVKLAELRSVDYDRLVSALDANAGRFIKVLDANRANLI